MTIKEIEVIADEEFANAGDDGLFPNHTDRDVWISGFKDGYLKASKQFGYSSDQIRSMLDEQRLLCSRWAGIHKESVMNNTFYPDLPPSGDLQQRYDKLKAAYLELMNECGASEGWKQKAGI
jgi:hypothetical protein